MRYLSIPHFPIAPSVLCLGTANLGTATPEELSFAIMDRFYEAGGNFFDSAHIYAAWLKDGWGVSERTLGAWIKSRGVRDSVVVCTKGAHPELGKSIARLSASDIRQDLMESLERLDTHYVDLYLLHRDNPDVPVIDILQTLEEHKDAGLIRQYGCSNWSVSRQLEAASVAKLHGLTGFVTNQVGYSLARSYQADGTGVRYMDAEMETYHTQSKVTVMAFSSQANGFFSGKYSRENPAGPNNQRPHMASRYGHEDNFRILDAATSIAKERSATPNQVALAWLMRRPFPCFPIIGPMSLEQLNDSLGAVALNLTGEELARLS